METKWEGHQIGAVVAEGRMYCIYCWWTGVWALFSENGVNGASRKVYRQADLVSIIDCFSKPIFLMIYEIFG